MKKLFKAGEFVLPLIVLALFLASCNNPVAEQVVDNEPAEDLVLTAEELGVPSDGDVSGANGAYVVDISGAVDLAKYASVVLDAQLYGADDALIVAEDCVANMAQFKLLNKSAAAGDWENDAILTGNNVKTGKTTAVVQTETGVPLALLIQKNTWTTEDNPGDAVKKIKISTITFKARTEGALNFGVQFGTSNVSVDGALVTWADAINSNCAITYAFPASWLPLTGKTITVSYTLQQGFDPAQDHQLIIQAAGSGDDDVNTTSGGQQYKDMNDPVGKEGTPADVPEVDGTFSGVFTIDGTALQSAAASFDLTRMRIANNGGEWDESGVRNHIREKSYSVLFNSITIE
jgi:hypothetical protein